MIEKAHSDEQIKTYIASRIKETEDAIVVTLQLLGEKAVEEAREKGTYIDRTGNLRSSIGYAVVANGRVVAEAFNRGSGPSTEEGADEGKKLLSGVAKTITQGYVLIVVAGMEYAVYVEDKGFNVLRSANLETSQQASIQLKRVLGGVKGLDSILL